MSRRTPRIVVLGNSFAARVQLPALRWAGNNRVVGLAGKNANKARQTAAEWGIPAATGDWRRLLDLNPDLVMVATPVDLHHEMVRAALETPAAILCEKPFTLDESEARELTLLADGRGAWIDHELRWMPAIRTLQEMLQEGYVGDVWHAHVQLFMPPARYRDRRFSWWFQAERGGGVLGALGSHLVDLLHFLLGDSREVSAHLRTFVTERPDDDGKPQPVDADEYASLDLRFASGATAQLETSIALAHPAGFLLQVAGSAGTVRLLDGNLTAGPFAEALRPIPTRELPTPEQCDMPDYGVFGRCLPIFLRDVVGAVAEGSTYVFGAATFADGLATQRVLDGARRSHANGGAWQACG